LVSLGAKADVVSTISVPDNTLSPDKRFGVTVPFSDVAGVFEENNLVEMKSKRVLGPINISTAYGRVNNSEILPAWWSSDDSYVLWQVNGKWGMDTQMLVCLKDGEIQWELDVIKVLQRAILTRTEALDPKNFLAAKKANWGDGSAYPEDFTFDSKARETNKRPLTFPVRFDVYLTSNPKGSEGVPEIDSYMEATLSRDGEINVTGFHSGKSTSSPWNEIQAAGRE
jgi:hypothetical protein